MCIGLAGNIHRSTLRHAGIILRCPQHAGHIHRRRQYTLRFMYVCTYALRIMRVRVIMATGMNRGVPAG